MNKDLKIIKKKYGEGMAKFCRETFPSLLEVENLLPDILMNHFNPSHELYKDIEKYGLKDKFKDYIYSVSKVEQEETVEITKTLKTPKQLLNEAGYNLYECKSEEDIQSFKKYYEPEEELCTFTRRGRLDRCYVFFAVKKDVDSINREDFKNPQRQDLYGTSVISIQFSRDPYHILSIKNRYNHTVDNPDATFSNNLDNIIPGLTESFEREYGLKQELTEQVNDNIFEIPNYVIAKDGKYYKFNQEIYNIFYCPDNIIIDYGEVKKLPKEKYILVDYIIFDLRKGNVSIYDDRLSESFTGTIQSIEKITVEKQKDKKIIHILQNDKEEIEITTDKSNKMMKLKNNSIKEIGDNFLFYNTTLKSIELNRLEKVGKNFLYENTDLTDLNTPLLKECDYDFLCSNSSLKELYLPLLKEIGGYFMANNNVLTEVNFPSLEKIEDDFLRQNKSLKTFNAPNLKEIGKEFMVINNKLTDLYLPSLEEVGRMFLWRNNSLIRLSAQKLRKCDYGFLMDNEVLKEMYTPNLEFIGEDSLLKNRNIIKCCNDNNELKGKIKVKK